MKTSIESSLTLESVAERFAQWRKNKSKGERIPEPLWREAIGLLSTYRISEVTRTLRLSGADLNKRRQLIEAQPSGESWRVEAAFMEVDPQVVHQTLGSQGSTGWLELARPDGLRLRLQPSGRAELLTVVNRFMAV